VSDATPAGSEERIYDLFPEKPRWTHIALRVNDIDASIDWYEKWTPMDLLARNKDDSGFGAWLGDPDNRDKPFILVLAQFFPDKDPFSFAPHAVLAPFAHIGIEMTSRAAVDEMADKGKEAGILAYGPVQMPPPVGYVCFLTDPDGNTVEYSFDQGVYATARDVWGRSDDD